MSRISGTGLVFSAVIMFIVLMVFMAGMHVGNSNLARAADTSVQGIAEGRDRLESEIQEAVRVPADVRSLNNSPLGFVYNVLKSGVLLLDRDEAARADFEGLTYKRYFDFQHLRKQYLREIINAPV